MLVVPCVLIGLLSWVFQDNRWSSTSRPALLGIFPFVVMFIVTSIATLLRTHRRHWNASRATPQGRLHGQLMLSPRRHGDRSRRSSRRGSPDLGWGSMSPGRCGSSSSSPSSTRCSAIALGLLAARVRSRTPSSPKGAVHAGVSCSRSSLVCGLLLPRDQLPVVLERLSDVLPCPYAVDAMGSVATLAQPMGDVGPTCSSSGLYGSGQPPARLADPASPDGGEPRGPTTGGPAGWGASGDETPLASTIASPAAT